MGQFEDFADSLTDERIESLVHADFGPLAFNEILEPLQTIRDVVHAVDPEQGRVSDRIRSELISRLEHLTVTLNQIAAFDPTTQTPDARIALINQVVGARDVVLDLLPAFSRSTKDGRLLDQAMLTSLKTDLEVATERALAAHGALVPVVGSAQQKSLASANSDAAAYFDAEATKRKASANRFLYATIGLTVALAGVAVYFYARFEIAPPNYSNAGDAIAGALPKITLLLALSFAVGFAARNYRVNSHLIVLNSTKAMTLRAATKYAASVDDKEHRDMVVASLVQAVFTIGDTGYLPVDSERTIIETPGVASIFNASRPPVNLS